MCRFEVMVLASSGLGLRASGGLGSCMKMAS